MLTLGKYEVDGNAELGSGGYGSVYRARHTETGELAAAKVVSTDRMSETAIMNEVRLMESLRHAHVIALHEYHEQGSRVIMIMELAAGGELFSRVIDAGSLQEQQAQRYLGQLMRAVEYMHSMGVAHRDLKLENVLLNARDECKVCDFGLAHIYLRDAAGKVVTPRAALREVCGSKSYAAPEVLAERGYDGFLSDVWSCGVCLFGMLAGFFPFDGATADDWRFSRACQETARGNSLTHAIFGFYQRPCMLSEPSVVLIDGMMTIPARTRMSVRDVFNSVWLGGDGSRSTPPPAAAIAENGRNKSGTHHEPPSYRGVSFTSDFKPGMDLSGGAEPDGRPVYRGIPSSAPPMLARQNAFKRLPVADA